MPTPRRLRRGFERAGDFDPARTGLSARRTRELRLALAWRRSAGAALADRLPAPRLRRGVLEIDDPGGAWHDTLTDVLPRIAGRMAARFPDLGLRRWRLVPAQGHAPTQLVEIACDAAEKPGPLPAVAPIESTPVDLERRLRALAARLARRARPTDQKP